MDVLWWLLVHADEVTGILAALHVLALAIVNLTPTPADDRIVGRVYKVIEALAGIFSETAKALPKNKQTGGPA